MSEKVFFPELTIWLFIWRLTVLSVGDISIWHFLSFSQVSMITLALSLLVYSCSIIIFNVNLDLRGLACAVIGVFMISVMYFHVFYCSRNIKDTFLDQHRLICDLKKFLERIWNSTFLGHWLPPCPVSPSMKTFNKHFRWRVALTITWKVDVVRICLALTGSRWKTNCLVAL